MEKKKKKGLWQRIIGGNKEKKDSCCCNIQLEEIPEDNKNESQDSGKASPNQK